MNTLKVRNITFGEGMPKICVPIVGTNRKDIEASARRFVSLPADVAEWRADWFGEAVDSAGNPNTAAVTEVLRSLRSILGETVLLFTFRTAAEGGEKNISPDAYRALVLAAADSGQADMADVELFTGNGLAASLTEDLHRRGVKVIVSSHDFDKTPDADTLVNRLLQMESLGADMPKIAVMPQSRADVLALLTATERAFHLVNRPIVTMSMAGMGAVSRICGEVFGSALTFGADGRASAPGQMDVNDLAGALSLIHKSL